MSTAARGVASRRAMAERLPDSRSGPDGSTQRAGAMSLDARRRRFARVAAEEPSWANIIRLSGLPSRSPPRSRPRPRAAARHPTEARAGPGPRGEPRGTTEIDAPPGSARAERSREPDAPDATSSRGTIDGEQRDPGPQARHDPGLRRRRTGSIPVTVIEAGPCRVVQLKTPERDGYAAVQLAFGDDQGRSG